jgi:4-hydroxy-3-polyprenylbenzoate decarboxylase
LPGVHAVHAVDAAGVHPLLLAIGSERYVPYSDRKKPQELLTSANAILGQGQLSLAKYLLIVAREDDPKLEIHDIEAFFRHFLERVDWRTDLHFQTCTTIDTLDYSGTTLNEGSKVIIAAVGPPRRRLARELPPGLSFPDEFTGARLCIPGVLAVTAPAYTTSGEAAVERFCGELAAPDSAETLPFIVLVDDCDFTSRTLNNFLWVTFTRSNPAADISGVGAFVTQKHWGCTGPLVIDARRKPHHAPVLEPDPAVEKRVDALAASGGPLHSLFRHL